MEQTYVFLDTNVFLHYRWITEIDWHALVGVAPGTEVVLVVAQSVMKELDEKQTSHPVKAICERARNAVGRLSKTHKEGGVVRPATRLLLLPVDPAGQDFRFRGLSPDIRDDQLLASILCLVRTEGLDYQPPLVAHDFALSVKAEAKGIHVCELPAQYKLPDARSEEDKAIGQLRREHERLKTRVPKIEVTFADGTTHQHFEVTGAAWSEEEYCEGLLGQAKKQRPKLGMTDVPRYYKGMPMAHPDDLAKYNESLDRYYEACGPYLKDQWLLEWIKGFTCPFDVRLTNTGTVPASRVIVDFRFPDGVLVGEDAAWAETVKQPSPPHRPWDLAVPEITKFTPLRTPIVSLPPILTPDEARVAVEGERTVTVRIENLKHHRPAVVPTFFACPLADDNIWTGFPVEYEVHADNLPEVTRGRLNVRLSIRPAEG